MNLKVGGELVEVRSINRRVSEINPIRVTKIGRTWAYYERLGRYTPPGTRFSLETWCIDGGNYSSPGKIYTTEKEYQDGVALCQAWTEFRNGCVYHQPPKHMTLEKLQMIKELLGEGICTTKRK